MAGAVADVGVLVPIAAALIVANGLSATAVLLPAGLLYIGAALAYGLPVPVQPLKALGAIAIAKGLGADAIAAAALILGVVFIVLGRTGLIDLAARAVPRAVVRGVQLAVGLLFVEVAFGLVSSPPRGFADPVVSPAILLALGAVVLALALSLRRRPIALALVGAGVAVALVRAGGEMSLGPSAISLPSIETATLWSALTLLVIPQLPLTFANSCVATADTARTYFGGAAGRITPGRLAQTLGAANLFSGAIAGMPVCHGAGGMTAHRAFGARTAGAPLAIGIGLVVLALVAGAGLAALLASFPLPVLGGMLAAAGVLHVGLVRDLVGAREWGICVTTAAAGLGLNLAIGVALGLALWWGSEVLLKSRRDATSPAEA